VTRIHIDEELCSGYGFCVRLAPSAFDLDAEGKAQISAQPTAQDDTDAVHRAARACPVGAITVEDLDHQRNRSTVASEGP
jgi:ferredoxin